MVLWRCGRVPGVPHLEAPSTIPHEMTIGQLWTHSTQGGKGMQAQVRPDVRRKDRPQLERKPRPVLRSLAELQAALKAVDQENRADAQGDAQ